jgi:hypothetical protein
VGKPLDLIGEKYGRLTVLEKLPERRNRRVVWLCRCDCGNYDQVPTGELRSGKHLSCGCYQRERASQASLTHGQTKTRLYRIWCAMIKRCENENAEGYENYGGRGISVCEEWRNDFEVFRNWALSHGYSEKLTIERNDVNGNYCPENCRWATRDEQMNNTRRTRHFEYNGEIHTLREWSEITGIPFTRLKGRLQRGWSIEKTLTEQKRRNQFE